MERTKLDVLYKIYSPHNGWLSELSENFAIGEGDERYLSWLDDCEAYVKTAINAWEENIENNGGLDVLSAEDDATRLRAIEERIKTIDNVGYASWYLAEAFRAMYGYQRLLSHRSVIRLSTDQPKMLSETEIESAKSVRLDSIVKDQLKRKFMKCPAHNDKTASLYVTSFGYCFGCQKSWNSISWIMEFEKMNFKEAVNFLNGR